MIKYMINALTNILTLIYDARMRMRIVFYKKMGIKIGKNFQISPHAYLDLHNPKLIDIGDNVKLTRWSMILCYDSSRDRHIFNKSYKSAFGCVKIGNNVYIGAHSIIMPGVTIGDNVLIGANSLINRDIPSNCIVAGSPAKKVKDLSDLDYETQ